MTNLLDSSTVLICIVFARTSLLAIYDKGAQFFSFLSMAIFLLEQVTVLGPQRLSTAWS